MTNSIYEIGTEINQRTREMKVLPYFASYDYDDVVTRGGKFLAYWDGEKWHDDKNYLLRKIDNEIHIEADRIRKQHEKMRQRAVDAGEEVPPPVEVKEMQIKNARTKLHEQLIDTLKIDIDRGITFNKKIRFAGETLKREDYATFTLPYRPEPGPTPAFDEMIGTWYDEWNAQILMWAIGAVLSDQVKNIQKFVFLYGGKGEGKGSVLEIVSKMFNGYISNINLSALTSGDKFGASQVENTPIMLDTDCDLSRIRDDTALLKLTSHEPVTIDKKYASIYEVTPEGMLFAASNKPFKVYNQNSGITRRALIVRPTGNKLDYDRYRELMQQVDFEISHIAYKAMQVFEELGSGYYEDYKDDSVSKETDLVYSFMSDNLEFLIQHEFITFKTIKGMYIQALEEIGMHTEGEGKKLKDQLTSIYYNDFYKQKMINGQKFKNVFSGLKLEVFGDTRKELEIIREFKEQQGEEELLAELKLISQESQFDKVCADLPAQLATKKGTPKQKWESVKTTLADVDTHELHWVKVPENHIVIDFDLKDMEGNKCLKRNVEEALKFPPTYTEVSKSGNGIHMHYIYDGDLEHLDSLYAEDIEIKRFVNNGSLRRQLTLCNDLPITHISTGLPLKESDSMLQDSNDMVWTEKNLKTIINRNLNKEYHSATKPSMDFINHALQSAKRDGLEYDLTAMRPKVLSFAMQSTNQRDYCLKLMTDMPFSNIKDENKEGSQSDERLAKAGSLIIPKEDLYMYDIEVFPNLFVVCYKRYGADKGVTLYNPTAEQIEQVLNLPLVGFFNRKYDNHVMYNALTGGTNVDLYNQSQELINGDNFSATYANAYEISYADLYEIATNKQSLKKWEIELGIKHDEYERPWDQPVPEEEWERVGEYCMNDVDATIAVFDAIQADYEAKCILSSLSGLPVNAKTQKHAEAFLFGNDRRPQDKFVYTDLSKEFPGYTYGYTEVEGKDNNGNPIKVKKFESDYKGLKPSEGGYVYSKPGVYEDVVLLDIESLHPTSAIILNYMGPYTQKYADLKQARVYVKHGNFEEAAKMFNGALKPYLTKEHQHGLSFALKIVINIIYGMSSAKFDNKFKHKDNHDNIVAKRGALFMIDLQLALEEKGVNLIHIKTDSVKIANCTPEQEQFIIDFGKKYGYTFVKEHTYSKLALVNKAVIIGLTEDGEWEPTGSMFAEPYVYKKLFSHEEIVEEDFATTRQVKNAMFLGGEFIGKVASLYASVSGKELLKGDVETGGKDAVTRTKGFLWRQMTDFRGVKDVDMDYYEGLVRQAVEAIDAVGDTMKLIPDLADTYKTLLVPF